MQYCSVGEWEGLSVQFRFDRDVGPMIQGVHATSVVFADFGAVSAGLLTRLSRRLPGIDAAGYPVRLGGAEFKLRMGPSRKEKRDLVVHLHVESKQVPSQSRLMGMLRLREAPTRSRTKVMFEGTCSRNFGGLSSTTSTEVVRHLANEQSRALLEVLVTAMEEPPSPPAVLAPGRGDSGVLNRPRGNSGRKVLMESREVVPENQLVRQLSELERVLDFLEQMNLRNQTEVPRQVVRILHEFGMADASVRSPSALIVEVLNRQKELRRTIASIGRHGQRPAAQ